MSLDPQILDLVAVAGAAVAVLALILALAAHLRVRRLRRAYAVLQGDGRGEDLVSVVGRQIAEVDRLRGQVDVARREAAAVREDLADALRHVAVVRYDAFGDMGGRLSFSAALLDDAGDGLVLTAITGRHDSRTYAKGLRGGRSDQQLSPEEQQAVGYALESRPGRDLPSRRGREPQGDARREPQGDARREPPSHQRPERAGREAIDLDTSSGRHVGR